MRRLPNRKKGGKGLDNDYLITGWDQPIGAGERTLCLWERQSHDQGLHLLQFILGILVAGGKAGWFEHGLDLSTVWGCMEMVFWMWCKLDSEK